MNEPATIFLSIIICSRNRAREIVNCLPTVLSQAKLFEDTEVIVVDNGSTDNTKDVVLQIAKTEGFGIQYVFEPIPGLCQARNTGRNMARGKVMAYIDDDVILKEGWILHVREHFLLEKSDCLGGKVSIELGGVMPMKLDENMHWFFMASNFGEQARPLTRSEHPTGCNMAFTITVFDGVGGFDTNLKLYGDETDFFRRVHEKGYSVYYNPEVEVSQFIPRERLTIKELKDKSFKWGQGAAANKLIITLSGTRRLLFIIEYALRTAYMEVMHRLRNDFGRFFTYWYNRGYLSQLVRGLDKRKEEGQ